MLSIDHRRHNFGFGLVEPAEGRRDGDEKTEAGLEAIWQSFFSHLESFLIHQNESDICRQNQVFCCGKAETPPRTEVTDWQSADSVLALLWKPLTRVFRTVEFYQAPISKLNVCIVCKSVMPLVGGQGGLQPTWNLKIQFTLFQPRGQIIPTTLLLAHRDLKT